MKFSWRYYYSPTPVNVRKWADVWTNFWNVICASTIVSSHPTFALIGLVLREAGVVVSNCFAEDEKKS